MNAAKIISSLTNPAVKRLVNLRKKKGFRQKEQSVVVIGSQIIGELAEHLAPKLLIIKADAAKTPPSNVPCLVVSEQVMSKISNLPQNPDWIAEFSIPKSRPLSSDLTRLLVLENIKDPGNLGTIFRTALAFGWRHIFLFGHTVDPWSEKALQAAKGASFQLDLHYGQMSELKGILKNLNLELFVGDMAGKPVGDVKAPKKLALALGSEVNGLSNDLKDLGQNISIPMSQGESLNVAVAGSILMYLLKGYLS